MNIPFEPQGTGGYRDIFRLAVTVTAFYNTYGQWPGTVVTDKAYVLGLIRKIPKEWQGPLFQRLRFEAAPEDNMLVLRDDEGHTMDYSFASCATEVQLGAEWLFSKPVKVAF